MTAYTSTELLAGLEADVQSLLQRTQYLQKLEEQVLNQPPAIDKWSVAQVLAHLNSYNRYYLPHIETGITSYRGKGAAMFRPGVLGNYFTKTMYSEVVSKKQVTNKMKSPKDHTPSSQQNASSVMTEFIAGQEQLIALIHKARNVDMTRVMIPISISRWIKIRLGDTLRFLIAHQERHFLQISNILAGIGSTK